MFSSNNKKEATKPSSAPSAASHALNSLVQGTVVEGTVKSENDIRVDGTIKGKLFCDAKVIIGPSGFINGEVRCKNAVIEGKMDGLLEVAELLSVKESAQVNGEVTTNKLIVSSGAVFNVNCNMGVTVNKGGSIAGSNGSYREKDNQNLIDKEKIAKAKPAGV